MKTLLLLCTIALFSVSCESKPTEETKTAAEGTEKVDDLKKEKELSAKIEAIDKELTDSETELQKESDGIEENLKDLDGI